MNEPTLSSLIVRNNELCQEIGRNALVMALMAQQYPRHKTMFSKDAITRMKEDLHSGVKTLRIYRDDKTESVCITLRTNEDELD